MDSLTQAALGAAIGEAALGKKLGWKGAALGAMIATIPDLDVVFYLFYNKFDMLSIHRGYSHSILFSIIGAFLISYVLRHVKWTMHVSDIRIWIFTWLTLITHMLLDAFTTYGTQLYLPFSNNRVGFDSINVVDPIYTVPLLIGLLFSLVICKNKPSRRIYNYFGLAISTIYLMGTLGMKKYVKAEFADKLNQENISYNSLLTVPVGIANIHWFGVAKTDKQLLLQKYSILNDEIPPFQVFPINEHLLDKLKPELADKMRWFAKGYYTVVEHNDKIRIYNLQVDMRGVVEDENGKAPTVGYFEIVTHADGTFDFGSGQHK